MITDEEKTLCLQIVKEAIGKRLNITDNVIECPYQSIFSESYGLFVTLHIHDELKGCIGYILPYKTLYDALIDLAIAAAFNDNRFTPVTAIEYPLLQYEISILSPLYEVNNIDEITVGRDGLVVQNKYTSGLLLPQVATENHWDRDTFLANTCRKAGLSTSAIKGKDTKIFRFKATIFNGT